MNSRAASPGRPPTQRAVRAIALVEASKGVLALAGASGLLLASGNDLAAWAQHLVTRLHLNPAAHYPAVFIHAVTSMQPRLVLVALGAAAYGGLRLAEGWGLYRGAAWAELLGVASGALYLPFEVAALIRHRSWLDASLLCVNLLVVLVLLGALWRRRRNAGAAPP